MAHLAADGASFAVPSFLVKFGKIETDSRVRVLAELAQHCEFLQSQKRGVLRVRRHFAYSVRVAL